MAARSPAADTVLLMVEKYALFPYPSRVDSACRRTTCRCNYSLVTSHLMHPRRRSHMPVLPRAAQWPALALGYGCPAPGALTAAGKSKLLRNEFLCRSYLVRNASANFVAEMVNRFYSLAGEAAASSFDLADLGTTRTEITPFGVIHSNGYLEGFEPFEVAIRAEDYDESFLQKLRALRPVYAAGELLTYHFDYFLRTAGTGLEFLQHVEYVLLPKLATATSTVQAGLVEQWLITQKTFMLSHHKQQRLHFLAEAYKAACTYSPGQPLSVTIKPFLLGEELNLDRATVSRIVNELVQDGLLSATLGMQLITVTRSGARQLEEAEQPAERPAAVQHNFHFAPGATPNIATGANAVQVTNTGAGAQVNVASGHAMQQTVGTTASLPDLVAQLRAAFAAEPRLAAYQDESAEEFQRLETQLARPEVKKNLVGRSFEVLRDLAQEGLGSVAGHAIFELLQQVPHLLHLAS